MNTQLIKDDWNILKRFLPMGWEEKGYELGAIKRKRGINSAEELFRVLLIHLADGKSLRSTAVYAREAGLSSINTTAIFKRFRGCGEWLRWIAVELLKVERIKRCENNGSSRFRIRLVDGTVVSEEGSTGTDWRIQYVLNLDGLVCDTFEITDKHIGESLSRIKIEEGDLILVDRGYSRRGEISHVVQHGGDIIVRLNYTALPLKTRQRVPFDFLGKLRGFKNGEAGDWDVYFVDMEKKLVKGRLCALRKSKEAIEKSKKDLFREAKRKGRNLRPETIELAEYILLFTTVSRHKLKTIDVLSLYRARWQIEIAFKRLKSIIGLGQLPKSDPESCKSWLYGKMLIAFLVENIYKEVNSFSPWGYPLIQRTKEQFA